MSQILRRLRREIGHFARSHKGPATSPNGAEAHPQPPTPSDRAPSREPGIGKRLVRIGVSIICVGILVPIPLAARLMGRSQQYWYRVVNM